MIKLMKFLNGLKIYLIKQVSSNNVSMGTVLIDKFFIFASVDCVADNPVIGIRNHIYSAIVT